MEITLWCCTLAEVCHCDFIFVVDSVLVSSTWCLRQLCAEWGRDCANVEVFRTVMDWHLFGFSQIFVISTKLMCHLLDRKTTPKECSGFTILREDQILITQSCGSADVGSLFSSLSHIETDSALSLSCIEYLISFIYGHHSLIHFLELVHRN